MTLHFSPEDLANPRESFDRWFLKEYGYPSDPDLSIFANTMRADYQRLADDAKQEVERLKAIIDTRKDLREDADV